MKSRESVVRLKQFQVEDKRRQVTQIETMIAEFDRMSNELSAQVASEHDRTGISDPTHFAYSTFAKAASQRRDNLMASADELRAQLDVARASLSEAEEELGKFEALLERERDADDVGSRRSHPTALAG